MRTTVVIGVLAMIVGLLAAGSAAAPVAVAARKPVSIQIYRSLSSFSQASRIKQTISFDDVATGASFGNPAILGRVRVLHSTAATLGTIGSPAYVPASSPNVLAPFRSDDTLVNGITTVRFGRGTSAAGLFLILPAGSNESTTWTTAVTATDSRHRSVTVTVTFQGMIGERQFVGFGARSPLVSISWDVATKPDHATSVLALDDVMVGRLILPWRPG